MMYLPRFFYDDAANDGGGTTTDTAPPVDETAPPPVDETTPPAEAPPVVVQKMEFTLEEAKGFGFDTKEQMIEHFTKMKEQNKSEEDKQKAKVLDDINFRKFSVENDLLKEDDFLSHQSLSAKADRDLLFDKYLGEFKEDNPELAADPELVEKATAEFNREWKLDSENVKVKERAIAKMAKEAKEMRSPVESKFETAKNQYELAKNVQAEYPKFEEFVNTKVKQHTPDKSIMYKYKDGEEDVNIEIDLTEDDRKAMAKDFATHKNFYSFKNGTKEEFEASLDKKMQSWVRANKMEAVVQKAVETSFNRGIAKGSNVGADNPFPLVDKTNNKQAESGKTFDEQLRESHDRASKIQ